MVLGFGPLLKALGHEQTANSRQKMIYPCDEGATGEPGEFMHTKRFRGLSS